MSHKTRPAYLRAMAREDRMSDKRHNGWANYETWACNLWMSNEQGDQEHFASLAQEAYDMAQADGTFTRDERACIQLCDMLKSHFEDTMADMLEEGNASCSLWADLLGAALSEVNWKEIADALLDGVAK